MVPACSLAANGKHLVRRAADAAAQQLPVVKDDDPPTDEEGGELAEQDDPSDVVAVRIAGIEELGVEWLPAGIQDAEQRQGSG